MRRHALLVLLAGCGQEPPPPAPPVFSASSLPQARALDAVPPGEYPTPEREVPDLDVPPPPPPRPFPPGPAWDRHHGYSVAHPVRIERVPPSSWYAVNSPTVLESLAFLSALQKEDGSWDPLPDCSDCGPGRAPEEAATKALVLLAFTRAGVPTREPLHAGRARLDLSLRRGLQRIIADQGAPDRSLRRRAMEVESLAGASDSVLCLDQARTSAQDLLSTPLAGADAGSIACATDALPRPPAECVSRARSALDALPPPADGTALAQTVIARMRLDRGIADPRTYDPFRELARHRPSGDRPDLVAWQAGTRAVFLVDGPNGSAWKAWSAALAPLLEERRRPAACPRALALITLTLLEIHRPRWRSRYGHRSA